MKKRKLRGFMKDAVKNRKKFLVEVRKAGSKGGKARARALTPEERSEIARMGGYAKAILYSGNNAKLQNGKDKKQ